MPSKEVIVFPSGSSAKKRKTKISKSDTCSRPHARPQLAREAVFSFLKDTRGMISWTAGDMAETLGVTLAQANDALPVLEMQGMLDGRAKASG